MAEFEGLLLALRKARAVGERRLVILTDSELVVGHIGKTYKAKKPDMMKYLQAVRSMEKFFIGITVQSFLRHYNKEADAIAKATALLEPLRLCPRMCSTKQQPSDLPLTKQHPPCL
jgi:ribonuclease HI